MANARRIDVGDVLGGFKIEKELGRGGMGVVYQGHELSLNRKVALKVLSERLCSDDEFIKRFKREAQVIAALNHPNIVSILSYGEADGLYFFAMEYVRGRDLGQILKEKGAVSLEEALTIGAQVASALSEAGSRGIVHRDLKPSNIMVDHAGRAKVTDFGVAYYHGGGARLTQTGLFLGTPEYASPEQATGKQLDIRSDIYALGAVLYRMLSGVPPITGESPLAVVTKIATESITPIGQVNSAVPKIVSDLVDKMMAKDLPDRFQTPEQVLTAITRCTEDLGMAISLTAHGTGTLPRNHLSSPQKSRTRLWGAAAGVTGVGLLIIWLLFNGFSTDRSEVSKLESARVSSTDDGPIASPDVVAKKELLPSIPKVLMIVTGHAPIVPLVQANLESVLIQSGFPTVYAYDTSSLQAKGDVESVPLTWQSLKHLVPEEKAQIIMLAQVDKTGSLDLEFHGRVQKMTTATFLVKVLDGATGTSAARSFSGSMQFTPLSMEQTVRKAVTSAAGNMGNQMKAYWNQKLSKTKTG